MSVSLVLNYDCLFCCEGKSGLDELHVMIMKSNSVQLGDVNERFRQFNSVLFSSCIDFERSVQTREINEKLDRAIRCLLIEISAFLYMKPTKTSPPHKALEWLVHRLHSLTDVNIVCFFSFNTLNVTNVACL